MTLLFILSACGGSDAVTPNTNNPLSTSATLAATCSGCHANGGGAIVSIDGLSEATLAASLHTYKLDTNGTSAMHRLARGYSDDEIEAIAAYLGAEADE